MCQLLVFITASHDFNCFPVVGSFSALTLFYMPWIFTRQITKTLPIIGVNFHVR